MLNRVFSEDFSLGVTSLAAALAIAKAIAILCACGPRALHQGPATDSEAGGGGGMVALPPAEGLLGAALAGTGAGFFCT